MTNSRGQSIVVIVDDTTKVGEARRRAVGLADQLGFDATRQGQAALVATEAAGNLIKHAGGGELIIQGLDHGDKGAGLDILAVDSGRGMTDVGRCVADGYSTAGTPGHGLGAIGRLADSFEIYSSPDVGTVLWARLDRQPHRRAGRDDGLQVGVIRAPAPGEDVCGDAWATLERDGRTFVLMVDGLGHGPPAAEAAEQAVRIFRGESPLVEPEQILDSIHSALRTTRGAALAIARLDPVAREVRYVGVGNISGLILEPRTGATSRMVSQNGIVGYTIRKIQVFQYPWTAESLLLMHSDGLATRWSFDRYPGLGQRHPSLITGVLYRDHKRGRDDVTILAAGFQTGGPS